MIERDTRARDRGMRLAVVFSRFPVWNQTFALADLVSFERAGFDVRVFALRGARGAVQQPDAHRFARRVELAPLASGSQLARTVATLRHRPARRLLVALAAATVGRPAELAKSLVLFQQAAHFASVMASKRIEHIHAEWASYPATVAWIASELTGIPFSFSAHAYDIYKIRYLLREKIAAARFVVTCADVNRTALLDAAGAGAAGKVHVHRHGVDLELFRPDGRAGRATDGVARLLACGNLVAYKGFGDLVDACDRLRRRGHRFTCSIIGTGPEAARLRRRIDEHGLSRDIRLLPGMPQPDLAVQYRSADVFVQPSVIDRDGDRDVIPNVLVEAMASGLPVVATRVGGIEELIEHGTNGVLVPPGDPDRLAAAVTSLLESPEDRVRLAVQARRRVAEEYDRRRNAEQLVTTFLSYLRGDPAIAAVGAGS